MKDGRRTDTERTDTGRMETGKMDKNETVVFLDAPSSEHLAPPGFPERPERLLKIVDELRRRGRTTEVVASEARTEEATLKAIEAVHDPLYVERFRRAVARGDGLLDSADNPLSPGTWRAALGAVSTALAAADWMMSGEGRRAFVAARPPGHHAERGMAMGFCFFNQIAVAAEALVRGYGLERIAIFDFDVHHGNGTQHLFEERADVFFASTHQSPFYPGTGAADEIGTGPGKGTTLNIPLPAGTGDDAYLRAIEERVLPWLRRARPQALLISAGFDAWHQDPLGGMKVSQNGFRDWGSRLGDLATEVCGGRLLSVLEGGYDLEWLPKLVGDYLDGVDGLAGEDGAAEAGDRSLD